MAGVVQLPVEPVEERWCPLCGFIMLQTEIDALIVPVDCRGCGQRTVNDFRVMGDGSERREYMDRMHR